MSSGWDPEADIAELNDRLDCAPRRLSMDALSPVEREAVAAEDRSCRRWAFLLIGLITVFLVWVLDQTTSIEPPPAESPVRPAVFVHPEVSA